MKRVALSLVFILFAMYSTGAQTHYPSNGPADKTPNFYTLTGATIVISPEKTIVNGSLTIKNGKIFDISTGKKIARGAVEIDVSNRIIYPAFVEMYAEKAIDDWKFSSKNTQTQQLFSERENHYWNDHIRSELNANQKVNAFESTFEKHRKMGFGVVNFHQADGIARGTSVALNLTQNTEYKILKNEGALHFAMERGSSNQSYPTSTMGQFALLRQFFADAEWYKNQQETKDLSLENYLNHKALPHILHLKNPLNYHAAHQMGKPFIYFGSENMFEMINSIDAQDTFILPLDFPKAFQFEDTFDERLVSLNQLKIWKQAPFQPALFEQNKIKFAFTAADSKGEKDFFENLKSAVENGLSEKTALSALTTIPAELLNVSDKVGTLEKGKWANFIIFDQNPFTQKATLLESWVAGERKIYQEYSSISPGKYTLEYGNHSPQTLEIYIEDGKPKVKNDSIKIKVTQKVNWITINLEKEKLTLSGTLENQQVSGHFTEKEKQQSWRFFKIDEPTIRAQKKKDAETKKMPPITYPNVGFGFTQKPQQQNILIKNITVWTMESDGVLENHDVLIKDGKIAKIGNNIPHSSAYIINGNGRHLTPGMIDEHSHAGIYGGVNEAGWNITSEVRIGDVLNPKDPNLFRQMARGVTTSQLLHGSANPIGGQSQIIKLRWGENAEGLKFKEAPEFIKFALGENVKQSNWGPKNPSRYPQTRLGVEQTFVDAFLKAQNYSPQKRKNYRLEALKEILDQERFITCHSYVQSEILMLMHVAEDFGFKVNTFTHILEGYKVAPEMKKHGVAASTFSDWWAYKFEVNDAIPYNAAILTRMGVNTAINSDDREMAQRLNQEAAKMIKYGGVSETEALAMITINPAKMLHIDQYVGSIKEGKHADLVLWSDHPLAVNSLADYTLIDGKIYFDRSNYDALIEKIAIEKNALIEEMKKQKGEKQKPKTHKNEEEYHCDTL